MILHPGIDPGLRTAVEGNKVTQRTEEGYPQGTS